MKTRFYLIVLGLFFLVLIALAAASSSPPKKVTPDPTTTPFVPGTTITVTIESNVGVKTLYVTNLNTGKTYTASLISLPLTFTCTRGDYLQLRTVVNEGYHWNAWWFNPMLKFSNDNPAIICADTNNPFGNIMDGNAINIRPDTIFPQASGNSTISG